ncbi:MAG: hypothetical protein J7647_18910 [Cyanobacteria bacterium SBLK]|nr:hypothetical protein [Cyanobacteria bacterium SBLK]
MNGIALVLLSIDNRKLPDRFFFFQRSRSQHIDNCKQRSLPNSINAIAFTQVLNAEMRSPKKVVLKRWFQVSKPQKKVWVLAIGRELAILSC